MRYYGDFRSIDTTVDPKGKLYRVLIFTGYKNADPYEYTKYGGYPIGEVWISAVYVPKVGTNITLTSHPVSIEYEGNTGNIHEPYIGSTASISFLQSSFNKSLVNSNGRDVLVVVLRQKDEVVQVNDNQYLNTLTGETLNKISIYGPHGDWSEDMLLFRGFEPKAFDNFVFNIEWVGFGTPDVLSVDYSSPKDVFTLNCQDALSTLEYDKYEYIGEGGLSFSETIFENLVGSLGTYRNIYMDDDVVLCNMSSGEWYTALTGSKLLQDNHFDENGEGMSKLKVLKEIMQFFGLVMIPWHNSLVVTTPEKVVSGRGIYRHYIIDGNNTTLLNWGGATQYNRQATNVNLSNFYELTVNDHAGGSTQLSTENIVKKVSIEDDILTVDDICPEFDNNDNFTDRTYNTLVETYSGSQRVWKVNEMFSAIDQIVTHQYEKDTTTHTEPTLVDPDTMSFNCSVTVTPSTTETNPLHKLPHAKDYPTCTIIDDGGVYNVGAAAPGTLNRRIYFHAVGWDRRDAATWGAIPSSVEYQGQIYTNISTNTNFLGQLLEKSKSQIMLEVISKSFLHKSGLYLNIDGSFTFYGNRVATVRMYPHQYVANTSASSTTSYVYGKVQYGNYWLHETASPGTYEWTTTEQFVKLYYDIPSESDAYGVSFHLKGTNTSNVSGIVVALPTVTGVNNIKISICRPLGPSNSYGTCASVCLLDGLKVGVYTERELFDAYFEGYNNLEFDSVVDNKKINEFPSLTTIYTSVEDTAVNLSQMLGLTFVGTPTTLQRLCNRVTGNIGNPEQILVDELANQYSQVTLVMDTPVISHLKDITPFSVIHWNKLNNYRFVPIKWVFDPEYDRVDVTAVSVFPHGPADTEDNTRDNTLSDVPRQYFRTGEVRATNQLVKRNTRTLELGSFSPSSMGFTESNGRAVLEIPIERVDGEIEAALSSVDASFGEGKMMFSIPDSVENTTISVNNNGHLIIEVVEPIGS